MFTALRMRIARLLLLLCSGLLAFPLSSASAQTMLDRVVGRDGLGEPLTISSVDGTELARLAGAVGVPLGFEGAWPVRSLVPIAASGQTLRAVLDAIIVADPRYEWREDDGVIVVRPTKAWSDGTSPLHTVVAVGPLTDITAGDALDVLARMVGVQPLGMTIDTRRFSVTLAHTATWLETLNAIVRAHGSLSWIIEPSSVAPTNFPLRIMISLGSAGGLGFGVPSGAMLYPVISDREPRRETSESFLDRIVGPDAHAKGFDVPETRPSRQRAL